MKRFIKVFGLVLLQTTLLISCGSTKVTDDSKSVSYFEEKEAYTLSCVGENSSKYYEEAVPYLKEGKQVELEKLIAKWTVEAPNDPDLFVIKYNLENQRAYEPMVMMSDVKPENGPYMLSKNDKGEDVFIYETMNINKDGIKDAAAVLEEALKIHPVRVDMWFGLIRTYLDGSFWKEAEETFYRCLEELEKTDNNWLWMNNKEIVHNGDRTEYDNDFILTTHDYIAYLHMQPEPETYYAAQRMTDAMLKFFPSNPVLLNLVAVDYFKLGELDKGIGYLEKAFEIAPNDMVIVGNLAYFSCVKNDREKFDFYADIMRNSGNPEFVQKANQLYNEFFNKVPDHMQR